MADEPQQQERTEPASPWRRKQFRERGEVARSREVGAAALFLAAGGMVVLGAPNAARLFGAMFHDGLSLAGEANDVGAGGLPALGTALSAVAPVLLTVLGVVAIVTLASSLLQTGLLWTAKPLKPNFGKLFSLKKLKNMFFSTQMVVELLKTLLKVGTLGFIGWKVLASQLPALTTLPARDVGHAAILLATLLQWLFLAVGAGAVLIAALDYAWQRRQMEQKMKMTREEAKRERMQQEGNPLFRGLRRQKHRDLSMNHVLRDVPKADVVLANPTHFSVALRYRADEGIAPRVVAKGRDRVALAIRREARRHGIPVMENPPLARALFQLVKVGHPVPEKLYQAVAEVMVYVYRIAQQNRAFGAPAGTP